MRRPIGFCAAVVLTVASAGAAAEDPVSFAPTDVPGRYALPAWPEQGWLVQQFGQHVEVRFPKLGRSVVVEDGLADTDPRLADVSAVRQGNDVSLRITFGCDCTLAVTGDGGKRVVFEIIGGAKASVPIRKATGPLPNSAPMPRPNPARTPPEGEKPLDVEQARERLMQQLMRAADAGLIKMKPDAKMADKAPADVRDIPDRKADSEAMADVGSDSEAGSEKPANEISAEDVAKTDGPKRPSETAKSDDASEPVSPEVELDAEAERDFAARCFAPEHLTFPDPQTIDNVWAEVSRLRAALVGEFDRIDRQAALDLTRIYLALDLVREAKATVRAFLSDDPVGEAYIAIAGILDGEILPETAVLRKPGCSEEQELWRSQDMFLSNDPSGALAAIDLADRTIERLPQRLREVSAANIGMAAAQSGDWKTARALEALANRSAGALKKRSQALLGLSATLAKWNGDKRRYKSLLRKISHLGGLKGDRALINLAKAVAKDEAYLTSPLLNIRRDLGALAQRERGTDIGAEAFALEVRLSARFGAREPALDLVDFGVAQGYLEPEDRPKLIADLVGGELYAQLERPLARSYLDDPSQFEPALREPGFRQALAASMIDIGVPTLAPPILRAEDRQNAKLMTKLAAALMDAGAAEVAERYLKDVPDVQQRERMATEIRLSMGKSAPDQPVYDELPIGDEDKAAYRLSGVEQRLDDAIARGDWKTAQQAAELKMALAPSIDAAEQLAVTALQAGGDKVPAATEEYLKKENPARLRALATLYAPNIDPRTVADRKMAEDLVDSIDAEISLIEEMLGDG